MNAIGLTKKSWATPAARAVKKPASSGLFERQFALLAFATDFLLINGSFLATSLFKFNTLYPTDDFAPLYLKFQLFVNVVFPVALLLGGAYRDIARSPLGHQATTSFKACLWGGAVTLAALYLARDSGYSRVYVVFLLAQVAVLIPFSRILLERVNASARLRGRGARPVLVVGEREPLRDLAFRLRLAPHLGYRVEGVVPVGFDPGTERPDTGGNGLGRADGQAREAGPGSGPRILRTKEEIRAFLDLKPVSRIFICDHEIDRTRFKDVVDLAEERSIETRLVRWPIVVPDYRARIHELLTVPLVPDRVELRSVGVRAVVKRAMDVAGSLGILILTSPFLALIAAAIKLDSPGPILYRQERVTRGGRRFKILKFRSMNTLADEERSQLETANEATGPLFKMRNDPRVTRVGSWLRRYSLDELPQIFNVLKGDLSLVGPRPPLPQEVLRYEPWQAQRLEAIQGMTGLWQVSGRSRLSFEEMCLLDLYYLESGSPLLDFEILMETLPTVLHGDGAY